MLRRAAQSVLRLCLPILILLTRKAEAHVKWFVDANPAEAPRRVGDVLTDPMFVGLFLSSVIAIYLFFLTDRWMVRKRVLAKVDERMKRFDASSILIMRISTVVFFLCLAAWSSVSGHGFYLTPELRTDARWVLYLQLALGLLALFARTAMLTGAGILVLYLAALRAYGAYHMIDYMIFAGVSYFLLVSNISRGRWRKSGFIVLFASTGLTLGWAAIEKFAYPHWAYPLLQSRPGMLMGMSPATYMTVSGFVEFNLAFILLGAASIVGRLVALGLQMIFILAIFQFGILDARSLDDRRDLVRALFPRTHGGSPHACAAREGIVDRSLFHDGLVLSRFRNLVLGLLWIASHLLRSLTQRACSSSRSIYPDFTMIGLTNR